ncbi:unnamed protein product [Musa acuminata subsp. burmannicoides]
MSSQRGGGGGGRQHLVVRSVWAWNLEYEFSIIASLVDRFSYVAFDTEFPGFLYRTRRPHRLLPPSLRYAFLKANVDKMELVQLGPHLFDAFGDLPTSVPAAGSGSCGSSTSGNSMSDATPTRRTRRPAPLQWHRLRPAPPLRH